MIRKGIPLLMLTGILTASVQSIYAQDIIHRKNGKKIEAQVTEISTNEIKYKDFHYPDGPTYTVEKYLVRQIVFENGKIEKFDTKYYLADDEEWHVDNRKTALKLSIISFMRGYTELSLERNIKVGQSYEVSLGGIGLGKNDILHTTGMNNNVRYDARGVFISGGYKLSNMPSFILFGRPRQKHVFHGTYIKPIAYMGYYSENQIRYGSISSTVERQNVFFGNLQIELGKQWEFANRVVFDAYFGIGYGFDNKKSEYLDNGNNYKTDWANHYTSHRVGETPGFSFTMGLKFGVLFDTKKKNR